MVIPVAVAAASTLAVSTSAVAGWSPKKPVEFIIMAGTGGGADGGAQYRPATRYL